MGSCLCDECAALCCRYFALPLDSPKDVKDYDNIRWYLMHENVVVFIDKKQWYIGIMTRCKNLQQDNRCAVYDTRPRICRSYSTDNCDYHGGEYDFDTLFTSAEQLRQYAEAKLGRSLFPRPRKLKPRRRRGTNGATVVSLPLLAGVPHNNGNINNNGHNGRAVRKPLTTALR